jgi:hypothetical protein
MQIWKNLLLLPWRHGSADLKDCTVPFTMRRCQLQGNCEDGRFRILDRIRLKSRAKKTQTVAETKTPPCLHADPSTCIMILVFGSTDTRGSGVVTFFRTASSSNYVLAFPCSLDPTTSLVYSQFWYHE